MSHDYDRRTAASKTKKLPSVGATQRWAVMDGDQQIGIVEKNRSTASSLEPYHASVGVGKEEKSVGAFYDEEEAKKKGPQMSDETRKKVKWGGLDAAIKAVEQAAK